ncbi:GNAT family N-acetyltransferase [Candidatus Woesearchaeota archaeon]|nr:GNAT family N-acetyltransferase [Candidatus Woesearchaeota archaeon]
MSEKLLQITPEEIHMKIISENHYVQDFKSYERELVNFLIEDAFENQKQKLSVTFLWFYQDRLVSYITLLNDKINLTPQLKEFFTQKGVLYGTLPALKIGRLCVDDRFMRRGLGKLMIWSAIQTAQEINKNKSGCRFLTLDAKRNKDTKKDPLNFYLKMGFKTLKEEHKGTTPMYLDLKFIEES